MVILASRFVRVSNSGIGGLVAAAGVFVFAAGYERPSDFVVVFPLIVLPAVVIGTVLVRNALRLGADCGVDAVVVRGLLWSRRIPWTAISAVSSDPAGEWFMPVVTWKTRAGTRRFTPLTGFWVTNDAFGFATEPARRGLRALRREWRGRVHAERTGSAGVPDAVEPSAAESVALAPGFDRMVDVSTADLLLDDVAFPFEWLDVDVQRGRARLRGEARLRPPAGGRRRWYRVTVEFRGVTVVSIDPDRGPLVLSWDITEVFSDRLVLTSSDSGSVSLVGARRELHLQVAAEPDPS